MNTHFLFSWVFIYPKLAVMSASLQPVPNPKFSTAPLTTTAQDIVSRKEIKIPVDFGGTYGPQGNSNGYQSKATFTLASNEEFVNLEKATITGDFTPSFFSYASGYVGPKATQVPLLDGSLQSLIARIRIGNSQGIALDEILEYNTFSAIVSKFTDMNAKREQDLVNFATQGTMYGKDESWSLAFDSPVLLQTNNTLNHNATTKVTFRIMNSSFKNRVPVIPAFLLKNGLQLELTFENPYKAFAYQLSPHVSRDVRIICTRRDNVADQSIMTDNWFIGAGRYSNNVTDRGLTAITDNAAAWVPLADCNVGTVDTLNPGFFSIEQVATSAPKWTQTLFVAKPVFDKVKAQLSVVEKVTCLDVQDTTKNRVSFNPGTRCDFIVLPFRYEVSGENRWSGFAIWNTVTDCFNPTYVAGGNQATDTSGHYDGYPASNLFSGYGYTSNYYNVLSGGSIKKYPGDAAAADGVDSDAIKRVFAALPIYPLHNDQLRIVPNGAPGGTTFSTWNARNRALHGEIVFMPEAAFSIPCTYANGASPNATAADITASFSFLQAVIQNRLANPYVIDWVYQSKNNGNTALVWDYTLKNLELKVDMLKPNAQIYQKWVTKYQDMSGLLYAFKRVHYQATQIPNGASETTLNIQIKLNLRSLCGLILTFQDQQSHVVNDSSKPNPTTLFYPSLSAALRRGLVKAEIVIGGQQWPYYPNKLRPDGTPVAGSGQSIEWSMEHMLSSENFFDTSQSGFSSTISRLRSLTGTNYMAMGPFDKTYSVHQARLGSNGSFYNPSTDANLFYRYNDARDFAIAFSLMKDDTNGQFTGVDCTQSSIVQINLYFDRPTQTQTCDLQSTFYCKTWAIGDAVAQFQADATTVRQ